jgi:hypothetical protein
VHEIEERKNQHINDLLWNHQEAFEQIKSYYKDITNDNLQLIKYELYPPRITNIFEKVAIERQ